MKFFIYLFLLKTSMSWGVDSDSDLVGFLSCADRDKCSAINRILPALFKTPKKERSPFQGQLVKTQDADSSETISYKIWHSGSEEVEVGGLKLSVKTYLVELKENSLQEAPKYYLAFQIKHEDGSFLDGSFLGMKHRNYLYGIMKNDFSIHIFDQEKNKGWGHLESKTKPLKEQEAFKNLGQKWFQDRLNFLKKYVNDQKDKTTQLKESNPLTKIVQNPCPDVEISEFGSISLKQADNLSTPPKKGSVNNNAFLSTADTGGKEENPQNSQEKTQDVNKKLSFENNDGSSSDDKGNPSLDSKEKIQEVFKSLENALEDEGIALSEKNLNVITMPTTAQELQNLLLGHFPRKEFEVGGNVEQTNSQLATAKDKIKETYHQLGKDLGIQNTEEDWLKAYDPIPQDLPKAEKPQEIKKIEPQIKKVEPHNSVPPELIGAEEDEKSVKPEEAFSFGGINAPIALGGLGLSLEKEAVLTVMKGLTLQDIDPKKNALGLKGALENAQEFLKRKDLLQEDGTLKTNESIRLVGFVKGIFEQNGFVFFTFLLEKDQKLRAIVVAQSKTSLNTRSLYSFDTQGNLTLLGSLNGTPPSEQWNFPKKSDFTGKNLADFLLKQDTGTGENTGWLNQPDACNDKVKFVNGKGFEWDVSPEERKKREAKQIDNKQDVKEESREENPNPSHEPFEQIPLVKPQDNNKPPIPQTLEISADTTILTKQELEQIKNKLNVQNNLKGGLQTAKLAWDPQADSKFVDGLLLRGYKGDSLFESQKRSFLLVLEKGDKLIPLVAVHRKDAKDYVFYIFNDEGDLVYVGSDLQKEQDKEYNDSLIQETITVKKDSGIEQFSLTAKGNGPNMEKLLNQTGVCEFEIKFLPDQGFFNPLREIQKAKAKIWDKTQSVAQETEKRKKEQAAIEATNKEYGNESFEEEDEANKRNAAATTIQKNVRGYLARKKLKEKKYLKQIDQESSQRKKEQEERELKEKEELTKIIMTTLEKYKERYEEKLLTSYHLTFDDALKKARELLEREIPTTAYALQDFLLKVFPPDEFLLKRDEWKKWMENLFNVLMENRELRINYGSGKPDWLQSKTFLDAFSKESKPQENKDRQQDKPTFENKLLGEYWREKSDLALLRQLALKAVDELMKHGQKGGFEKVKAFLTEQNVIQDDGTFLSAEDTHLVGFVRGVFDHSKALFFTFLFERKGKLETILIVYDKGETSDETVGNYHKTWTYSFTPTGDLIPIDPSGGKECPYMATLSFPKQEQLKQKNLAAWLLKRTTQGGKTIDDWLNQAGACQYKVKFVEGRGFEWDPTEDQKKVMEEERKKNLEEIQQLNTKNFKKISDARNIQEIRSANEAIWAKTQERDARKKKEQKEQEEIDATNKEHGNELFEDRNLSHGNSQSYADDLLSESAKNQENNLSRQSSQEENDDSQHRLEYSRSNSTVSDIEPFEGERHSTPPLSRQGSFASKENDESVSEGYKDFDPVEGAVDSNPKAALKIQKNVRDYLARQQLKNNQTPFTIYKNNSHGVNEDQSCAHGTIGLLKGDSLKECGAENVNPLKEIFDQSLLSDRERGTPIQKLNRSTNKLSASYTIKHQGLPFLIVDVYQNLKGDNNFYNRFIIVKINDARKIEENRALDAYNGGNVQGWQAVVPFQGLRNFLEQNGLKKEAAPLLAFLKNLTQPSVRERPRSFGYVYKVVGFLRDVSVEDLQKTRDINQIVQLIEFARDSYLESSAAQEHILILVKLALAGFQEEAEKLLGLAKGAGEHVDKTIRGLLQDSDSWFGLYKLTNETQKAKEILRGWLPLPKAKPPVVPRKNSQPVVQQLVPQENNQPGAQKQIDDAYAFLVGKNFKDFTPQSVAEKIKILPGDDCMSVFANSDVNSPLFTDPAYRDNVRELLRRAGDLGTYQEHLRGQLSRYGHIAALKVAMAGLRQEAEDFLTEKIKEESINVKHLTLNDPYISYYHSQLLNTQQEEVKKILEDWQKYFTPQKS